MEVTVFAVYCRPVTTTDERRRRLRAARGYAGFSHVQLAEELGVSRDTVQRFEAGKAVDAIEEEVFLRRSADACGLPYEFFTVDFAQLAAGANVGARFGEFAEALVPGGSEDALKRVVEDLSEDFAQAAAAVLAKRLKEAGGDASTGPLAEPPPGPLLSGSGDAPTNSTAAEPKDGARSELRR